MRRLIERIAERILDWVKSHSFRPSSIDYYAEGEDDAYQFRKRPLQNEQERKQDDKPATDEDA